MNKWNFQAEKSPKTASKYAKFVSIMSMLFLESEG